MQVCTTCHKANNPDEATFCERCGSSSLKPYRKRHLNFSHEDMATLVSTTAPAGNLATTLIVVILLVCTLFIFIVPPPSQPSAQIPSASRAAPPPTRSQTRPTATPSPTPAPATHQTSPAPSPTATPTATPTSVPTQTSMPKTRQLTSEQSATISIPTTGQVTFPATSAIWALSVDNTEDESPISFQINDVYPGYDGPDGSVDPHVTMVIDQELTVPAYSRGVVQAHVQETGSIGNIPLYSYDESTMHGFYYDIPCSGLKSGEFTSSESETCLTITNTTLIQYGADAQSAPYVSQQDIDNASNEATNEALESAQNALSPLLADNEHFVGEPACTTSYDPPDPAINSIATQITVTGYASCTVTVST